MPEIEQYEFLIDRIPLNDFLEIVNSQKDLNLWQEYQIAKQHIIKQANTYIKKE